jgi:DNA (cytosine-5)-methyltransferase 1
MRVVSLFSGCGGMDLGFVWAGYTIIWANDIDHDACETYKLNIGNHIIEDDIANINLTNIPDCDVILGGFPCQDFSMIWKRGGIETDRGNLYQYFVKAVNLKQPSFFVAENVKGLLTANKGKAIEQIIKDFKNCGYNIYPDIYNFADYGTPQLRQRVLIIGIRKDLPFYYQKPRPTHTPSNYVTSGEALQGVKKAIYNNEHLNIRPKTAEILRLIPEGCNFKAIPKDSVYYVKGMISHVYRRLDRNQPATTIIAAGGGGTWGYHYHEPRPLTNRERARLFGYPDDFQFIGKIASVRRQIGNSVCPNAIKVIAEELKKVFDNQYYSTSDFIPNYLQLELPIKITATSNFPQLKKEYKPMQYSSLIHTASSRFKQQYNLVDKIKNKQDESNNLVALGESDKNIYLTPNQTVKFLEMCERGIREQDLDFRRKNNLKLGSETIIPEINFQKVKGSGNRLFCSLRFLENYVLDLYKRSINLNYHDAKIVVEHYDSVLAKPKKYGMRGQRNFTGKIEDEVRGKLAEHGFGKYAMNISNIEFPVDYSLVSEGNNKRDKGDFNTIIINNKKYDLNEGYKISLKSTNGNYLAIPQRELGWEGEIFILVKLHIKETFLYKAIKAGLQLSTLNLNESLGWLEIRGVINKTEFQKGYLGEQLPDKTQLSSPNYIKAPSQLEQDPKKISNILEQVKNSVLK